MQMHTHNCFHTEGNPPYTVSPLDNYQVAIMHAFYLTHMRHIKLCFPAPKDPHMSSNEYDCNQCTCIETNLSNVDIFDIV